MKIVALYGAQYSGKSTAADAVAALKGWRKMSFADPLYDMMSALLGEDARKLNKTEPRAELRGKCLRTALQLLGTEWGRGMIGEEIWLDAMNRRLVKASREGATGVVIDDLRFRNEFLMLDGWAVSTMIKVERPESGVTKDQHASEQDWLDFPPDYVVTNGGSLRSFQGEVRDIVRSLTP